MRFFSRHPKPIWIFAFGNLWDTFSYFGTQTVLALYFIHVFHLSHAESYLLYGAYAAFAFSTPLLGGIIADKWLGSLNTMLFGSLLSITGNLILFSMNRYLFCLGLATSLIGSGLFKSNSTHLIGMAYPIGDTRKESGFLWLYLAINLGGTLGPLVYGAAIYLLGWNYGFLFSAAGVLIGFLWLIAHWQTCRSLVNKPNTSTKNFLIYIGILILCVLLSLPLYFFSSLNFVILIIFAVSIIYIIRHINRYAGKTRQRLLALLIICCFGTFYFAAGMQIGTTITLFVQHKIDQGFINTRLPASTFTVFYPLFVLLLAPFFTYLWYKLKVKGITFSAPSKLAMGIGLAAIAILVFALASLTNWVISGMIVGNLVLSAGELILMPAAYTAVNELSPSGMQSTMMGCWILTNSLGGYLSSVLATVSHKVAQFLPLSQLAYFGEFLFIAATILVIALLLMLSIPKLLKMMN